MSIIKSEFLLALNQVATERGISPEEVIASIEAAVIAAYRKEYPEKFKDEPIKAIVNKETGEIKILRNDKDITPPEFGRIATQTAKQVIIQKIREAEKQTIIAHYQSQIGTIVKGRIIRSDNHFIYVDIGRVEAFLPKEEQIKNENYLPNTTMIFFLKSIESDKFGNPRIIISRTHPGLILELLEREVPEVANGSVEVKKIVREPGERAKVAVFSSVTGIDPVGACVGQKGIRVQTVSQEIGESERIDIILWSNNKEQLITTALSPAKIKKVELNQDKKKAKVYVDEKEAPLAIGKGGVNINLASKLADVEIDVIQVKSEQEKNSLAS
ncbi:MAG: transcription termination factor NusA [Patescibacteria group bacterium]|nr:transcription termination factor NusA [Patescibacteria group bacterium]